MSFKKQIIAAMAGVAMLALPVSSFAANHNYRYNQARAFAQSQALVNHSAPTAAPRYAYSYNHAYNGTPPASWTSTPNQTWHPNSRNNGWLPPAQWHNRWNPYAWNNGYVTPPAYRPYAAPVYGPPVYPCPAPSYSGYSFPGYGYSGYGLPGYANNQNNLSSLLQKRYNAMENIARLRAEGDSKGAARLVPIVQALNNRINRLR